MVYWMDPDNPGQSLHLEILNLIMSADPLCPLRLYIQDSGE